MDFDHPSSERKPSKSNLSNNNMADVYYESIFLSNCNKNKDNHSDAKSLTKYSDCKHDSTNLEYIRNLNDIFDSTPKVSECRSLK